MKARVFLVALGLALFGAFLTVQADNANVRIAGGPPAGEYITFARQTCEALGALFSCNPMETKGSGENVDRLKAPLADSTAADVIFLKGNMAETWQKEPGFVDNYVFVRSIAGEAIFLVMKPETADAVRNWAGVKEAAFLLSLGLPGEKSGDAAVFKALQAIDGSPLQALDVKYFKGKTELVTAVQTGQVQIGWFVQYPNPDNALFKAINDAGLVVMGVVDPDFLQLGGSFGVQDVTIANAKAFGFGGAAKAIHTATIRAAILARAPKAYPNMRGQKVQEAAIARIQRAEEVDLLPKAPWIAGLINSATITAAGTVGDMYNRLAGEAMGAKDRVGKLETK